MQRTSLAANSVTLSKGLKTTFHQKPSRFCQTEGNKMELVDVGLTPVQQISGSNVFKLCQMCPVSYLYHKRCSHRFTSFWHNSAISKSHKFTTGDTHFSAQPYGCRSHKSTSKQKAQTLSSNARWTHPTESEMTASCLQDFCCNFACFWVRLHRRNFCGNPLVSGK